MQDSLFENLHGIVECYENGKRKWVRENKITTLGRVALLSKMVKGDFYWTKQNWINQRTMWEFDNENSFISLFALGDGARTNDNGLPTPAKFADTTLNTIIPIISKDALSEAGSIFNIENFVDIYADLPNAKNTDTLIMDDPPQYRLQNSVKSNTVLPPTKEYMYFKRVEVESKPTSFSFANPETSARYKLSDSTNELINIDCAIARLRLEVSGKELKTVTGNSSRMINELSLYISGIYKRIDISGDETNQLFSYPSREATEEEKEEEIFYPIIDGQKLFLPIQFSHVTFPTEVFDSDEKNITFIYNIFA